MKIKILGKASIIAIAIMLLGITNVTALSPTYMYTVNPWQAGNAGYEMAEAAVTTGYSYPYYGKIDNWDTSISGDYTFTFADGHTNTITISNNDGKYFDFSATNSIGTVIVKASTGANIFVYDPQVYSDTGLYGTIHVKPNGEQEPYDISHVTFCWNPTPEKWNFRKATGWAKGTDFPGANWAMYVPYSGVAKTVDLQYGRKADLVAGKVTLSAPDGNNMVTITIDLYDEINGMYGWYFGYGDLVQLWNASVHIKTYSTKPTEKNPAPGLFPYHYNAEGNVFITTLPRANYYAIHTVLMQHIPQTSDQIQTPWYIFLQHFFARFPNAFPILQMLLHI
jgi:hypothetical protein